MRRAPKRGKGAQSKKSLRAKLNSLLLLILFFATLQTLTINIDAKVAFFTVSSAFLFSCLYRNDQNAVLKHENIKKSSTINTKKEG